ncbi:hypothetical protein [Pseudomonas fulva]|nr:hypothetical protein [Pseudomonas fulva]MBF8781238.1 hypothetical protein [Pseudomonas fulva]
MKEWEIIFLDQHGVQNSLVYSGEECPSHEDAARAIRARFFPVMEQADLNDFENRVDSPTEHLLKEKSSVTILGISERS